MVGIIAVALATYRWIPPTMMYEPSSLFSLSARLSPLCSSITTSGTVVPMQVVQSFRDCAHTRISWSDHPYVRRCSSTLRSRLRMTYASSSAISHSTPHGAGTCEVAPQAKGGRSESQTSPPLHSNGVRQRARRRLGTDRSPSNLVARLFDVVIHGLRLEQVAVGECPRFL